MEEGNLDGLYKISAFSHVFNFIGISLSTALGIFIVLTMSSEMRITRIDDYTSSKRWIWSSKNMNSVPRTLIENFSRDGRLQDSVVRMVTSNRTQQNWNIKTECRTVGGPATGSYYTLCHHSKMEPTGFVIYSENVDDTVIVQQINVAPIEDANAGVFKTQLGIYEAQRSVLEWKDSKTLDRGVFCTSEPDRLLNIPNLGTMIQVDCSANLFGCLRFKGKENEHIALNGFAAPYNEVFYSNGMHFVTRAWTLKVKMGKSIISDTAWPMKNCLATEKSSLVWYGIGVSQKVVHIISFTIFSKLQWVILHLVCYIMLRKHISPLSIVGIYGRISRLGIFILIGIQSLYSSFYEWDILMIIVSWNMDTTQSKILLLYITSSVVTTHTILSSCIVRYIWFTKFDQLDVLLHPIASFASAITALILTYRFYSYPTRENGLLYRSLKSCPSGYNGCSQPHLVNVPALFSYLVSTFVVILCTLIIRSKLMKSMPNNKVGIDPIAEKKLILSNFENTCLSSRLDRLINFSRAESSAFISYTHSKRSIKWIAYSSLGYANIDQIGLVHYNELIFLILARYLPIPILKAQNISFGIWTKRSEKKLNFYARHYVSEVDIDPVIIAIRKTISFRESMEDLY